MGRMRQVLGRASLVERLTSELRGGVGAITLVGPGGIGKTAVARRVLSLEGGHFIDLASQNDVLDALAAVAEALGARIPRASTPDALAQALTQVLLQIDEIVLLDNVEQLAEELAPVVQAWLEAGVTRLLLTSRIPVSGAGSVVRVGPIDAASGRALFVAASDSEVVDPGRHESVIDEIVALVGGLPLAIELAAARTVVATPAQIRDSLREGLVLDDVVGEHSQAHASLREVVQASWRLLDPADQAALSRLCWWDGPLTVEDASELSVDAGTLWRLTQRSFLSREVTDNTLSFRVFVEVRAVLLARGDADEADRETWARAVVERATVLGRTRGRRGWAQNRQRFSLLVPNLRAALLHAPRPLAQRAWYCLAPYVLTQQPGRMTELWRRHRELLSDAEPQLRARIAAWVGVAMTRTAPGPETERHLEEQIAWALEHGQPSAAARGLACLASLHIQLGRPGAGREAALRALEVVDNDDPTALGQSWSQLGRALMQLGDLQGSLEAKERAVEVFRSDGYLQGLLSALSSLAVLPSMPPERARALHEEAVSLLDSVGADPLFEGTLWANRALRLVEEGEPSGIEAAARAQQAFTRGHQSEAAERYGLLALLGRVEHGTVPADDARARLRSAVSGDRTGALTYRLWSLLPMLCILEVEAGDRAAAEAALVSFAELAQRHDVEEAHAQILHMRALIAAERGQGPGPTGHDLTDEALAVWAGSGNPGVLRELLTLATRSDKAVERQVARLARRALLRTWILRSDGSGFSAPDAEFVDLSRRAAPRRLLAALLRARMERPGQAIPPLDAIEAGWPGERMSAVSAKNRLHTVVRELRRLGLEALLQTVDAGYRLDPAQRLVIDAELPTEGL